MKLAAIRVCMKLAFNYRSYSRLLFAAILGICGALSAQESSTNSAAAPSGTSVTQKRPSRKKPAEPPTVKFDASAIGYSSASPADNGSVQQFQAEMDLVKPGDLSGRFNMLVGAFNTESSFYYALPEAYLAYGDKYASLSGGRKIENFSAVDRIFNFGLFEGHQTNDMINFNRGGLVMLSAHYNTGSNSGFFIGYSPLFVPNQGPQITAKDGKIISGNRWAASPPKQFKFGDQNQEIIYAVSDFNLVDILMNTGIVANAYFGENRERPLLNLSFAKKPINDLVLSRDTFADISTFQGNVILTPHVLFHEIYAADMNLDFGILKTTLSYVQDTPTNKIAPELETIQNLEAIQVTSFYMGADLTRWFGQPVEIYAAAAQIAGGAIKDITSDGQPGSFSFSTSRTQYRRPLKAGVKGELMQISGRPLATDLSMIYDQELKGSLLSAKFRYAVNQNLNLSLAADIIGVESEIADGTQSNFLDQNQANDRISAGVGYAF